MASEPEDIMIIEYHMMDQLKYKTSVIASSLGIRVIIYPFNLVRTRLLMQQDKSVYKGTLDALGKIYRNEGPRGLYRGLAVNCCQIPSGLCYIYTYEKTRSYLKSIPLLSNTYFPSLLGGALASFVGQTIMVPIDIVIQHIQLLGTQKGKPDEKIKKKLGSLQRLTLSDELKHSRFGTATGIIKAVYHRDGLRGFYRGYLMSLCVFVPSSSLWWPLYDFYSDTIRRLFVKPYSDSFEVILPYGFLINISRAVSGVLAGISSVLLTHQLDIFRTRMQVDATNFSTMWSKLKQEKSWYYKGLSARMMPSVIFSLVIAVMYENIKVYSVKDEYRHLIK